ncbi:MAG: hypothetical protein JW895_10860 [Thermoleophilaceae bacterium]|nr:hypothetical protein [Thermoleophilaceae bacterium]
MAGSRTTLRAAFVATLAASLAAATAGPAPAQVAARAKLADTAKNARAVNGIRASRRPRPGMLVPLGRGGRFPASVLANIVDSTLLQRPLAGVCPPGQAIRAISRMGAVTCQVTGDITSITAGQGLTGGGASGAIDLAIAPPLAFDAGAGIPLLDIKNNGTGGAVVGESSSGFASAYFRALGTSDGAALRADTTAGSQGNSVSAYNYGTDGYGLLAELVNPANPKAAIFARTAGGGQAVRAEVNSDGGADALYARSTSTDPTSYAGFFSGNVNITGDLSVDGMLSKGGGTFRIDHPLAPRTRWLQHSFVESPDMKNIYDGVVRTDGRGRATVRLPAWFQALNGDFRYQLTPIRSWARAIVWREVERNTFVIRTSRPHVRVSWQVTGIRHDAFAKANRVKVDVAKPR